MEIFIKNKKELTSLLNTTDDSCAFLLRFEEDDKSNERSKRKQSGTGSGIHKT